VQREEASGFSPYVVHYRLSIPALSDIKELKKNSRRRTLARTASDKRLAAHQQHINQQLFLVQNPSNSTVLLKALMKPLFSCIEGAD
jgi:hypothetical protein